MSGSLPKQRKYFSLCAQGCVSVLSHVSNTCAGNTTPAQLAAAASERRQSVTECREQGAERARCVNIAPVCRLFFLSRNQQLPARTSTAAAVLSPLVPGRGRGVRVRG